MRIGVMLRHLGEHGGGVDVYTRRVLTEMLRLPCSHEFVFLYRKPEQIGTFGAHPRLREIVIDAPAKILWDQVSVPLAMRREKIDLLFNPKYSLPLAGGGPGVFVLHGIDWYSMPWGSRWQDRLSHRHLVPRYVSRASSIICVSESVRREVLDIFPVDPERVSTVHYGVDEEFFREDPPGTIEELRERFELPGRYFLFVGQIYPPKNMARVLEAFAQVGPEHGIHLAIAGEHRWLCEQEMERMRSPELARWVKLCGWADRPTLRALYRNAQALVFPSLYEGFGLPIVEAMASGCPVITSDGWSMRELAEGASLLVEPKDVTSIERAMTDIAVDEGLRQDLIAKGYERVKSFNWRNCALETLRVLEATVSGAQRGRTAEELPATVER
jgi:glycosyltransferase involved in cell wall biosynthesis